ncbi:acyl-CoA dehydrogenase family protein [Alkalihalobacterium chitinilyticum]|uniref:Acyl-CoA dehydrogenase family protein n=1 Tax=Alkalihalobacterium chitinilyticum TaxID=2980103 RepID=A0ABT5VKS7_9BACI|nr:acyl-CoA dehydrogenase family protein [Alkalihalobacterium chitinilyticum]MDE5415907.1 acyl-CoA dehydrogenase family protein [Alkalihalobacterium chitinilyticum]
MDTTTKKSTYSFDRFLEARNKLNHLQNPFLHNVLDYFTNGSKIYESEEMKAFSNKVSNHWRKMTEENARVENQPRLLHFDAHNHRIDDIVRPHQLELMEKEVFAHGLFSASTGESDRTLKRYLLHHNGEAGLMCPLACTDGLVALLETYQDELHPELKKILLHSKEGIEGDFAVGAQFMSEIQGGSNIPANQLEAVPEKDYYRLYGHKFFCSATHADYSVVTARVQGTDNVACFVVPTYENELKDRRNGHVVNRLKRKLGTCELPSGEINYEGAKAYRVGPIERGVAIAVSIVLTRSRLDIGFGSAAFIMRAAREAVLYANFRDVFGRKINEFPLAKAQLQELEDAAKRATVSAFHIHNEYLKYENLPKSNLTSEDKLNQFVIRELILLQKVFVTKETIDHLRTAISIFGGHGAIEDFSAIPRLFRDAMVNELWEGPRNVLLAQTYRDFKKAMSWCTPHLFIGAVLPNRSPETINELANELKLLLKEDLYAYPNESNIRAAKKWTQFLEELYMMFQEDILVKINDDDILPKEILNSVY